MCRRKVWGVSPDAERVPTLDDRRRHPAAFDLEENMRNRRFCPPPALAVASLALVVALGGTALAGPVTRLTSTISGGRIKLHTIVGQQLVNNTLTGTQISERQLGTVPSALKAKTAATATTATSAATAHHADLADDAGFATTSRDSSHALTADQATSAGSANTAGGYAIRKVKWGYGAAPVAANGNNTNNLVWLGGLTLRAVCGAGAITIEPFSSIDNAEFHSEISHGNGSSNGTDVADFDSGPSGSPGDIVHGVNDGLLRFIYTVPDGTTVSGEFNFKHDSQCFAAGFATTSATPSSGQ
jgi:hypothetical protein